VVTKRPKVQGTEKWGVKCSELQCSEVMRNEGSDVKCIEGTILGELFLLSLIYKYVPLCRFCAVRYLFISASVCYFLIILNMFSTILFIFVLLSIFVLYFVFSVFLSHCVFYLFLSCLLPIFYKSTYRCHLHETQFQ